MESAKQTNMWVVVILIGKEVSILDLMESAKQTNATSSGPYN